jgi:hypothetical protein
VGPGERVSAECPSDVLRELSRLRRKNAMLREELRFAIKGLDHAFKLLDDIRKGVQLESDWREHGPCLVWDVRDAVAKDEERLEGR